MKKMLLAFILAVGAHGCFAEDAPDFKDSMHNASEHAQQTAADLLDAGKAAVGTVTDKAADLKEKFADVLTSQVAPWDCKQCPGFDEFSLKDARYFKLLSEAQLNGDKDTFNTILCVYAKEKGVHPADINKAFYMLVRNNASEYNDLVVNKKAEYQEIIRKIKQDREEFCVCAVNYIQYMENK